MKTTQLAQLNLQELSLQEQKNIDGGCGLTRKLLRLLKRCHRPKRKPQRPCCG